MDCTALSFPMEIGELIKENWSQTLGKTEATQFLCGWSQFQKPMSEPQGWNMANHWKFLWIPFKIQLTKHCLWKEYWVLCDLESKWFRRSGFKTILVEVSKTWVFVWLSWYETDRFWSKLSNRRFAERANVLVKLNFNGSCTVPCSCHLWNFWTQLLNWSNS